MHWVHTATQLVPQSLQDHRLIAPSQGRSMNKHRGRLVYHHQSVISQDDVHRLHWMPSLSIAHRRRHDKTAACRFDAAFNTQIE